MRNEYDEDVDEVVSCLIEELRLRLEEVGGRARFSSGSRVLGDCGSNNGEEEDDNGNGNGSEDLGVDYTDARYSEDDGYSSESKEDDDTRDNDDSGEEHDETDSSEDSSFDDSEGDDEARSLFPCPFCSINIEVHELCIHFQEEHCFDVRNAVCPLCAGNLDRNVTRHFMVQHRSSLKRRRKFLKRVTSISTMLGKELSSFLGYSENSRHNPVPDVMPLDDLDSEDIQQDEIFDKKVLSLSNALSSEPFQNEIERQGAEKRRQAAAFVQEVVVSTIL